MTAITDLATASSANNSDYIPVNQSGTDRKMTRSMLILDTANTFTAAQTVNIASPSTGITLPSRAGSTGHTGPHILIGRNTGTETPGFIRFTEADSHDDSLYFDNSGILRCINNDPPTATNFASGTVVGSQTSSLDAKDILGSPLPMSAILAAVRVGAGAVRCFTYKNGAMNGEEFSGVITDYAPRYGMDRDDEHPAGKALNVITVIGDLLIAVAELTRRVETLEAKYAE